MSSPAIDIRDLVNDWSWHSLILYCVAFRDLEDSWIGKTYSTSASAGAGDARRRVRNGSHAASLNVVTCGSPITPVGGNSPRPG